MKRQDDVDQGLRVVKHQIPLADALLYKIPFYTPGRPYMDGIQSPD